MKTKSILLTTITTALFASRLAACDFCVCELPEMGLGNHTGWHVSVSEQFTRFGTLQQDGQTIANPGGEYLDSSITQFVIGYDFAHALGVQLNVPLVYRSFQRWHNGALDKGSVSGVGDVSFLAHWAPIHIQRSDFLASMRFFAGISLPTGDSRRVLEEAAEAGGGEGEEATLASGIHGHDITLGSGSVSGLFGVDARLQWKRLFLTAGLEAVVRTRGAHGYTFADEMNFHGALGTFLVDGDKFNLALSAECTGSTRGQDVFQGVRATDTSSTVVYLGPQIAANWAKRYHAEVGVQFPVLRENSGVQAVPDYRVSATFGVRF
ncbi:MAG: hypothetical protein ABIP20_11730 [Chthoniobacteraceae bacterium]